MEVLFTNPATGMKNSFLYQWDTNVDFDFEIKNGMSVEAVFSTVEMKEGIRKPCINTSGNIWNCKIPDKVLQYGTDVTVYITYISSGRRVVDFAIISVRRQIKPSGYISTTSDVYVTTEELLQIAREAAAQSMTAAKISEAWAHGHKDYPNNARDNAKYYSEQAKKAQADTERTANNFDADIERIIDTVLAEGNRQIEKVIDSGNNQIEDVLQTGTTQVKNVQQAISDATAATGNANAVAQQLIQDRDAGLFKGDKGDKGDKGESGVTAPGNGFFTLSVDDNGDLWAHYADNPPPVELDEDGNLYYVVPD